MTAVSPERIPRGVWPVMLTPFRADGAIDWRGLEALTEWYLERGAAGLFAVCLSSEMFELDGTERIAIAKCVVQRVAGRVPVVATGGFGGVDRERVADVRRMAATEVAAVGVPTSLLAGPEDGDAACHAPRANLRGFHNNT